MEHKRGASFVKLCTYKQDSGTLINLTSVTITAQVRTKEGELVSSLTVAKLDQTTNTGKYTLTSATDTWPLGRLICDIRYAGANVDYTDTFAIDVIDRVTAP